MSRIRRAIRSKPVKWTGIAMSIAAIALMAGILILPHFFGWSTHTVLSSSMSPALHRGDVIMIQPVAHETIKAGDIITYGSPLDGKLVTHRVIEIEENSLYFKTQGDANEDPDPYFVPCQNIAGKVRFHIPLLGYMTHFVKTPLGFILMLGIPGLIVIGVQIRSMWVELSEEEKRKKAKVTSIVKPENREYTSPEPTVTGIGGEE